MRESLLTVSDARKSFGGTPALQGASLALDAGELLGLLGPNGAGKTTLVRAIAGRVRLDGGEIALVGAGAAAREPARRARRRSAGDRASTRSSRRARTSRSFGRLHGLSRQALPERVAWALAWTGLDARADEPVKRFSGGMRRRLNIACGVLHEPRVLLLDEPTVGVDPQSRERIYEMLSALRKRGDLAAAHHAPARRGRGRCDRIVVIDHGRVVGCGNAPAS